MKRILVAVFLLSGINYATAQKANGNFLVSLNESLISWSIDYSIGQKGHEGTLKLISGTITVIDGMIQSGNFVIDINSIHVTDMKPDDGGKDLEEHLKNDDFFSAAIHPKGFFSVLSATPASPDSESVTLKGYLIIKGISNVISFPVMVIQNTNTLTTKADFAIDRTKWGINYHSGSIFSDLKDGVISDELRIKLSFVFKKAE